jgi:hypothetical protein
MADSDNTRPSEKMTHGDWRGVAERLGYPQSRPSPPPRHRRETQSLEEATARSIERLEKADPKDVPRDVQVIVASQLDLLSTYHEIVLQQATRSFNWALVGAGAGMIFFIVGAGYTISKENAAVAAIPVIAGAVVEAIAGLVFLLYGRTTAQFSDFYRRLEATQRYLLANSICSNLGEEAMEKGRLGLIREIMRVDRAGLQEASTEGERRGRRHTSGARGEVNSIETKT